VEACLVGGQGAAVELPPALDPFVALFSESAGRVLVTAAPDRVDEVRSMASAAGVAVASLGTTGGASLTVASLPELTLAELRSAWEETLPALFG
jgi:phosphoribosylformylglycinamidine synthase